MLRSGISLAIWITVLVLPFTGLRGATGIGAVLFAASLLLVFLRRCWRAFLPLQVRFLNKKELPGLWLTKIPWQTISLVGMLLLPLGATNYVLDVLTLVGLYALLALGLNITVGLTGLLDLGYAAFYAVGAYVYAILSTRAGLPFWLGLPVGGLGAGVVGMVLGLVTLRLRGDYLAVVTLGFIQIVHLILNNWDRVTNGPNGILNIGRPTLVLPSGTWTLRDPIHFYYLIWLLALLAFFAVRRLERSWIGRAWIAIREDELAAEVIGIDTTRMKVLAFTLGASIAGVAGVFFAGRFAFVSPESFTFLESVFVLSIVVLGGMGSPSGVVLASVVLVLLPELFRGFSDYRMLVFGGVLVLITIFRPQGLRGRNLF